MFITLSHYHYILVFRDLQRSLTTKLAIRSGLVVPCCPAWHGRAPFILNQWIWSCDQRDEEHQFEDFFGDGDGERVRERERKNFMISGIKLPVFSCSLIYWEQNTLILSYISLLSLQTAICFMRGEDIYIYIHYIQDSRLLSLCR